MTLPLRSPRGALLVSCVLTACGGGPADATGPADGSGDTSPTTQGSTGGDGSTATDATGPDAGTTGSTSADATTEGVDTSEGATQDDGTGTTTGVVDEPNVLYVRSDGADGNPGTIDAPMRTIQWAIATAEGSGIVDTIRVAEGDYGYDFANVEHLVMVEGVSLFGGYRDDWADRDPTQFPTNLVDEADDDVATSLDSPHRAIEIPASVTAATVLDGFHIGASHGEYRTAIWAAGAATIRDNVIVVDIVDGQYQWGIYVDGADAVVTGNRVRWNGTDGIATAIEIHDGSAWIANNLLDVTENDSFAVGVRLSLGSPSIVANTIAISGQAVGIVYDSGAAPVLENNLVEAADDGGTCLRQNGEADPSSLRNNVLDCLYTLHRINAPSPGSYTSIAELEAAVPGAQDNLKLDGPVTLGAPDFALGDTAPCTVARGGLELGPAVPDDIDGLARTAPLSIGAYEWDRTCL